jgi:hypothetical protein
MHKARRRRRTRRVVGGVAGTVAALCGLVLVLPFLVPLFFGGVGHPEGGPGRTDGEPSVKVRPLLDSPTRGSLAGDERFIAAILDRITGDPGDYGLPGDRNRLRVLFAGDLPGNRREVIVSGIVARPQMINLTGKRGASAGRLELTGWGDVEEPIVRSEWRGSDVNGFALLFGPAGYDAFVSERPRYLADGTVTRDWQPEPAGFFLRDTAKLPPGLRVRLSRGGTVFYEGRLASAGGVRTGKLDPNPLYGRGKPAPIAASTAADALAYQFGLTGADVRFVVLWSDDYQVEDPNGDGTGLGQIATVQAITPDGGGPYTTIVTDATTPQPSARNHPSAEGLAGDPATSLILLRMPHFTAQPPDTLRIIAPPAAVRVELRRADGTVAGNAVLSNGIGRMEQPGPLDVTARAFDAEGRVVAERPFADLKPGAVAVDSFEPEIKGW